MIKRLITTAIIMLAAATAAQAQATDEEQRAQKAKQILDKMSATNQKYSTIKADFKLTIDDRQSNKKNDFEGSIATKGDKYKLDIMNTETLFDGHTVYSWLKDAGEVNISEPDPADESALTPDKMFGAYEKGYKMRYLNDVEVGAANCAEIDLYPTERSTNISRIRLSIDKNSYNVKTIMQQCKDGTTYYIEIKSFTPNAPIADSEFTFDKAKHPDVEVIDLR